MMRSVLQTAGWLFLSCAAWAVQDPPADSFAWRGTLDSAGRQGLVRVTVPADALARMQSAAAADLRVFDGAGRAVPYTLLGARAPQAQARAETASFAALPLYAAPEGRARPAGAVQLRIDETGERRSLWVQLGSDANPQQPEGAQRLPSALFDTRRQQDAVTALVVRARLPANVPVRLTLATSPDLETWTPVAAAGRIFRFEGEGAPAQDTLELATPLLLRDRYLRVDWSGQQGVSVDSVVGLIQPAQPQPEQPAVALGMPSADGAAALEWALPFATPIAGLALALTSENTVVPVRVLGRNQPSEPWRPLAQAVLYRLGSTGQESTSAPVMLAHPSVRWLRVEATHGARLEGSGIGARVLFDPVQVVFAAGSAAPYRLAAGRAGTPPAALPASVIAATTGTPLEALPLVAVAAVQSAAAGDSSRLAAWLPGGVDGKTASLWGVLALGVLVLGGVAWALHRQLQAEPTEH